MTSLADDRDTRARLVDALYTATWGGGGGIETAEQVPHVLDSIGLDGAALATTLHLGGRPEAGDDPCGVTRELLRDAQRDEVGLVG